MLCCQLTAWPVVQKHFWALQCRTFWRENYIESNISCTKPNNLAYLYSSFLPRSKDRHKPGKQLWVVCRCECRWLFFSLWWTGHTFTPRLDWACAECRTCGDRKWMGGCLKISVVVQKKKKPTLESKKSMFAQSTIFTLWLSKKTSVTPLASGPCCIQDVWLNLSLRVHKSFWLADDEGVRS